MSTKFLDKTFASFLFFLAFTIIPLASAGSTKSNNQSGGTTLTPEQLHLLLTASGNGTLPVIRDLLRKASREQITRASTWLELDESNGDSPLTRAARCDELGAFKLLLPILKDLLPVQNKANQTPIHEAVANNATRVVEFLFQSSEIVNTFLEFREGTYNRTPLYLAAEFGHFGLVKFFTNLGANLYARSSSSYGEAMPIHEAARWDHREIVIFLHSRGCSVGLEEGWWHRTPLHEAAINGSVEMVKLLIERGADVFAQSNPCDQMYTPMHWAVALGNLNVVRYLLDYDPYLIDATNRDGDRPIHTAALNNRIELVELFLNLGVDINLRQLSFSRSLLHQAASKGHLFLVHRLIQLGADPYAISNQLDCWQLPVHLAAGNGRFAVFKALIEQYPDMLMKRDGCHRNMVDLASSSTRQEEALEVIKWIHQRLAHHDGSL